MRVVRTKYKESDNYGGWCCVLYYSSPLGIRHNLSKQLCSLRRKKVEPFGKIFNWLRIAFFNYEIQFELEILSFIQVPQITSMSSRSDLVSTNKKWLPLEIVKNLKSSFYVQLLFESWDPFRKKRQ